MTTRKPDWAQRAVEKAKVRSFYAVRTNYQDCPAENEPKAVVLAIDFEKYAARILRAHHRKVKRMVRKTGADRMIRSYYTIAYKDACRDILAELKEMERW